jgi:hypothetical protein
MKCITVKRNVKAPSADYFARAFLARVMFFGHMRSVMKYNALHEIIFNPRDSLDVAYS